MASFGELGHVIFAKPFFHISDWLVPASVMKRSGSILKHLCSIVATKNLLLSTTVIYMIEKPMKSYDDCLFKLHINTWQIYYTIIQ